METPVPHFRSSISKLGLDSREDLGITVGIALAVYWSTKPLFEAHFAFGYALAIASAGALWRFLLVPGMASFRKTFPPAYIIHWVRSRVILAPVLHPDPDPDPLPGVLPDPTP